MGAVILGALALYLLVSIAVVKWAIRYARKHEKNTKLWGFGAAFIMYNLVFWDWIPTVVAHKYYCATEAGFWVYKTLDQWKAENPGVLETLVEYPIWQHERREDKDVAHINQRFSMVYIDHLRSKSEGEIFLHVWRWTYELVDSKTNEVLAKSIDFSTGNGFIGGESELRFWLHSDHCSGDRNRAIQFGNFIAQFKGAKK